MKRIFSDAEFKEKYFVEEVLGEGAYGKVFLAKEKLTNKTYAIKQIDIDENDNDIKMSSKEYDGNRFSKSINELMTAYITDSKYLVKIHDYFFINESSPNTSQFCLVMDYYKKTLQDFINEYEKDGEEFTSYQIIKVIHDVAVGLLALKVCRIAHRDLKPQNIMWSVEENCFKLIDLGSCILYFNYNITAEHSLKGTPYYMAPEIKHLRNSDKAIYNPHSIDMFSLGMIALKLSFVPNLKDRNTGKKHPFYFENINKDNYEKLLEEKLSLLKNKFKNDFLLNLMKSMLSYDYNSRPTCEELLKIIEPINVENDTFETWKAEKKKTQGVRHKLLIFLL